MLLREDWTHVLLNSHGWRKDFPTPNVCLQSWWEQIRLPRSNSAIDFSPQRWQDLLLNAPRPGSEVGVSWPRQCVCRYPRGGENLTAVDWTWEQLKPIKVNCGWPITFFSARGSMTDDLLARVTLFSCFHVRALFVFSLWSYYWCRGAGGYNTFSSILKWLCMDEIAMILPGNILFVHFENQFTCHWQPLKS